MSADTMAPEVALEEPDVQTEDERVLRWRIQQFERIGFDSETSFRLGVSKVDWHDVETLIERGCSIALAERIVL